MTMTLGTLNILIWTIIGVIITNCVSNTGLMNLLLGFSFCLCGFFGEVIGVFEERSRRE